MRVMHYSKGTPLSATRSYGMDIILSMALDMCGSLQLIILYLLKTKHKKLRILVLELD